MQVTPWAMQTFWSSGPTSGPPPYVPLASTFAECGGDSDNLQGREAGREKQLKSPIFSVVGVLTVVAHIDARS